VRWRWPSQIAAVAGGGKEFDCVRWGGPVRKLQQLQLFHLTDSNNSASLSAAASQYDDKYSKYGKY
jgi:hypothetical protein